MTLAEENRTLRKELELRKQVNLFIYGGCETILLSAVTDRIRLTLCRSLKVAKLNIGSKRFPVTYLLPCTSFAGRLQN